MVLTGKTALVTNQLNFCNNTYNGKATVYYRLRSCDTNLNSNTPANQYQRLKHIQNTVGVYACMYTSNLAGLNVYESPSKQYQPIYVNGSYYIASPGVNWNQMSDRRNPHTQKNPTASGSTYHGSSYRRSIVRHRPGALNPGGTGCDIKHNSYNRYLNRIKGKAPYKTGVIPPGFGEPVSFNRAYPVYGGKVVKTNIVSGCLCGPKSKEDLFYKNNNSIVNDVHYEFSVGEKIFVIVNGKNVTGTILEINGDIYKVELSNGNVINTTLPNIQFYTKTCENIDNNLITITSYGTNNSTINFDPTVNSLSYNTIKPNISCILKPDQINNN